MKILKKLFNFIINVSLISVIPSCFYSVNAAPFFGCCTNVHEIPVTVKLNPTEIQDKIAKIQGEIAEIKGEINSNIEPNLAEIKDRIAKMQGEIAKTQGKIAEIKGKTPEIKEGINSNLGYLDNSDKKIQQYENRCITCKREMLHIYNEYFMYGTTQRLKYAKYKKQYLKNSRLQAKENLINTFYKCQGRALKDLMDKIDDRGPTSDNDNVNTQSK